MSPKCFLAHMSLEHKVSVSKCYIIKQYVVFVYYGWSNPNKQLGKSYEFHKTCQNQNE